MRNQYLLLLAFVLISSTVALRSKSTKKNTTDTEPANNISYGEQYRPGYHFTAPQNWINDPIGLVYFHGLYHLYYQYNPWGNDWGNMSWGHAVSVDLVYWQNLEPAIEPYKDVAIFSGSTIVDVNNTSGFCTLPQIGCLIAYYTSHVDYADGSQSESQSFAYSNNFGVSYTPYKNNPIIDEHRSDHRDPKVFFYAPESKWIMITAVPMEYKVKLYSSTDLRNWTVMSEFGPMGSTAGGWEDPDLFQLAVDDDQNNKAWILSHAVAVNAVEYYIGTFDGTTFTETSNATLYIDYGRDFDEAATWNNEPKGRRLMIAWLDEGQYGGSLPERGWRGQLTLIRELSLKTFPEGPQIVQKPLDEMAKLRISPAHIENAQVNTTTPLPIAKGTQLELNVTFTIPTENVPSEFGVNVFVGKDQITTVGYLVAEQLLYVNRTDSGAVDFDPTFSGVSNQTLAPVNGTINLRIFVDTCSVEVFANGGRVAMSNLVFPDATQDDVNIYTVGGNVNATVDSWTLKSIWPNKSETAQDKKASTEEFLTLFDSL